MNNNNTYTADCHFTPRAALVALGVRIEQLGILKTLKQHLNIQQKVIFDSPLEKVTDALITILAGDKGCMKPINGCGVTGPYNEPLVGSGVRNNRSSAKPSMLALQKM